MLQVSVKKIKLLGALFCVCSLLSLSIKAQENAAPHKIYLKINCIDTSPSLKLLKIKDVFSSQSEALDYLKSLPNELSRKGYVAASVDSISINDSSIYCKLYLGKKYILEQLDVSSVAKTALDAIGYNPKKTAHQLFNFSVLESIKEKILQYYENNGYPFASIGLDSFVFSDNSMSAKLLLDKGVQYHLDSIKLHGNATISNSFLQRYLLLPKNSLYKKNKLAMVDQRLSELPFLSEIKPSDVTMLGTGSILNVYVKPQKCSQINFLLGLQPASGQSENLQLTGNVNFDLKNLLGTGENFIVKWQQYQPQSPRINVEYMQPFLFRSPVGVNFMFDLYKKDTTFIQLNSKLGLQYLLSAYQSGKIFVQLQNNMLLSGAIDTNNIKINKTLPSIIDANSVSVGLNYNWNKTNYRLNPREGNEINVTATLGIKKITINTDIAAIKDPAFNYMSLYDSINLNTYQIRIMLAASHYFPLGKSNTLQLAVQAGLYNSPDIFKNDLFQIGGNKLLRGFDEESIYATKYGVLTAEYRIINATNSYVAFFTDYGFVNKSYTSVSTNNHFLSAGIGLVYETKIGLLNVSYALGKRDDIPFRLRESSKIHIGYVNYF